MRLLLILTLLLSGCTLLGRKAGKVTTVGLTSPISGAQVSAVSANPDNAAAPTTQKSNEAVTTVAVEAGTKIHVPVQFNGQEVQATFELPALTLSKKELIVQQSASAPDKSVALKQIDSAASQPFLWASMGAALLGVFFIWQAHPSPATLSFIASGVFFMAWKVSNLPSWFWAVAVVALCVGGGLYLGYERRSNETQNATPSNSPRNG